jgi:hypothetical protein
MYSITHQLPTIMHSEDKEKSPLQKVLDTLPTRHGVIRNAQNALAAQGHTISRRGLYEVVKGRSKNPVMIEAILNAAEAAKNQAAELTARTEKLAQA